MCFPEQFVLDVIIPQTNKNLSMPIDLHEFYVWLGCIYYMACFQGIGDREEWWSSSPIDQFKGAPFRLNGYMSKNRFKDIMGALCYTDKADPLLFVDKFHEVRQMIDAFNEHYELEYSPAWISCLDESMNSWLNNLTRCQS